MDLIDAEIEKVLAAFEGRPLNTRRMVRDAFLAGSMFQLMQIANRPSKRKRDATPPTPPTEPAPLSVEQCHRICAQVDTQQEATAGDYAVDFVRAVERAQRVAQPAPQAEPIGVLAKLREALEVLRSGTKDGRQLLLVERDQVWDYAIALTAAPQSEPAACPECDGPLQWRCPACRIAQSKAVADPAAVGELPTPAVHWTEDMALVDGGWVKAAKCWSEDQMRDALASAPHAWEPLTDEQIDALPMDEFVSGVRRPSLRAFARAIERAHGIG